VLPDDRLTFGGWLEVCERLKIYELGMSGSKYVSGSKNTSLAKCMAMIQHWRVLPDDRLTFGGWLEVCERLKIRGLGDCHVAGMRHPKYGCGI